MKVFFGVCDDRAPRRRDAQSVRHLASKIAGRRGNTSVRRQGGQPLARREAYRRHPGKVARVPREAGKVHQTRSCGGIGHNAAARGRSEKGLLALSGDGQQYAEMSDDGTGGGPCL